MLRRLVLPLLLSLAALSPRVGSAQQTPSSARLSDASIEQLIGAMTVDEKIGMVRGGLPGVMGPSPSDPIGEVGYLPGVPRLGIPAMRLTDGPAGVRIALATTALPAPVALAATFSTDHARRYGAVLGRESRAMRQDAIYGPMMNIVRVPQGGRNFETLGEDPLLASKLAEAEIGAIQQEGVIATAKHFAENNQENERSSINVNVDERTLNEIELPAFEASVKAGVGSVMCSYNKVNGLYACENPTLLTDILRNRWGFDGFVVSDYGANHSTVASLKAGMDAEFLNDRFATLKDSLNAGRISVTELDRNVRHILRGMNRFGLLAGASPTGGRAVVRERPPLDTLGSARVARAVATDGAVLMKNGGALPLRRDDLRSLVVIGPSARHLLVGGGGSSRVVGFRAREKSQLDALRELAGTDAKITYVAGIDLDGAAVPAAVLAPAGAAPGTHGLLRADSATRRTQVDSQIDFLGGRALPPGSRLTWTGTLDIPSTGVYELKLLTDWGVGPFLFNPGGNSAIFVDGAEVASNAPFVSRTLSLIPTTGGLTNATGRVQLTAGPHPVRIVFGVPAFYSGSLPSQPLQLRFAWVTPTMRRANIASAAAAARSARAALVFAHNEGTEGVDRPSLALPLGQDELISAIVAANPRTTVVLNTGDPVLMPWASRANAILQMWYPGQEGGGATADLLLGTANPSGRLPVTFPAKESDAPTAMAERYPGVNGQQSYSEGTLVGYRWYDSKNVAPLFPFGHGLSYTTFRYTDLTATPSGDGYDVSFRVRNTGTRSGAEVAQVYVGAPSDAPVPMARQGLAGFERIALEPNEQRQLTVHVAPRQLSYWSADKHDWVVAPGRRAVSVGSSSRDVRLRGAIVAR